MRALLREVSSIVRTYINPDQFRYIEDCNGVTARQFAKAFGIHLQSARTWLSRWTGRGYLILYERGSRKKGNTKGEFVTTEGIYKTNPEKWWGYFAYDSERVDLVGGTEKYGERPRVTGSLD